MKRSGFTLVEVLITIAIIATLPTFGFFALFKYTANQSLELAAGEVSAAMRDAQKKSITQENGKSWGVRFISDLSGRDSIAIFYGTSFSADSVIKTISLRNGIKFGEPTGGNAYDISFSPIDGTVDYRKIITLNTGGRGSNIADVIINPIGKTTVRIESNVVGYWHFDEGINLITNDSSGNGILGNFSPNPSPGWQTVSECKVGSCLSFHGNSNVSMSANENFLFNGDFTISFWEKVVAPEPQRALSFGNIGESDNFDFSFNDHKVSSGILVFWGGDRVSGRMVYAGYDEQYTEGSWHHIAFTRRGDITSLYADGILLATSTFSGVIGSGERPLFIARGATNPGHHWKGVLDEIRIYDRALTASEIETQYNDLK